MIRALIMAYRLYWQRVYARQAQACWAAYYETHADSHAHMALRCERLAESYAA